MGIGGGGREQSATSTNTSLSLTAHLQDVSWSHYSPGMAVVLVGSEGLRQPV